MSFTKFEVHYESGHIQKLLKDNPSIREERFKVYSPKTGMDTTSLLILDLDRIEECIVVVEGYSKLIEDDDEEFFRLREGYYIRKSKNIYTGRQRVGA